MAISYKQIVNDVSTHLSSEIVVDETALLESLKCQTKRVPQEFERAVIHGVLAELLKSDKPRTASAHRGHMTRAVHRIVGHH